MLYPFVHQFFPISEFSALTPTPSSFLSDPVEVSVFVPSFANVIKRFLPFCVLRLLLFLSPICLASFTFTLQVNLVCSLSHTLLKMIVCLAILLAATLRAFLI